MIDLKLTVVPGDGIPYTVAPTAGVLIAAERHFGKPAAELFASPSVESIAWLAWEQSRRDGISVKPFDTWIETLQDVQTEVETGPLPETE